MAEYKKGSSGSTIKKLQLQLNTRLRPSPKLKSDGIFGPKTEVALKRFQQLNRLVETGVADAKTIWNLKHPMTDSPAPPNLTKFTSALGTDEDFVGHVKSREAVNRTRDALINDLSEFFETTSGRRYLLIQSDDAVVIDFRHFFAAMGESYSSARSRRGGMALGGSPGNTVMLGVANEVSQCVSETIEWKLNSCFSREDLGSNRLGAAFGELLRVKDAEASTLPVSQHLKTYLAALSPLLPERVNEMKGPTGWHTVVEVLSAIVSGIGDQLVSKAY